MPAFVSSFLSTIGELAYTLPAAFSVIFFREWFRNLLMNRFSQKPENSPLFYVDTIAVGSLALFGVSWGGIIHSKRVDNFITFLLSQFFLIILFFLFFFYLQLNKPEVNSYSFSLFTTMGFYSFILFLLNFLPIPPFDLSFVYMQDLNQGMIGKIVLNLFKFLFLIICLFQWLKSDYFFKKAIYSFLSSGS